MNVREDVQSVLVEHIYIFFLSLNILEQTVFDLVH